MQVFAALALPLLGAIGAEAEIQREIVVDALEVDPQGGAQALGAEYQPWIQGLDATILVTVSGAEPGYRIDDRLLVAIAIAGQQLEVFGQLLLDAEAQQAVVGRIGVEAGTGLAAIRRHLRRAQCAGQ